MFLVTEMRSLVIASTISAILSAIISFYQVLESHQASKKDTSGTAKDVIACFEKLGVPYDMNKVCFIFMLDFLYKLFML